jgi:hypothetical protein
MSYTADIVPEKQTEGRMMGEPNCKRESEQTQRLANNSNTQLEQDNKHKVTHEHEHLLGTQSLESDVESHYREKCRGLELENKHLINLHATLTSANKRLLLEKEQFQQALEEEKIRSSAATEKGRQLKEQLDDLYRSYIHSINNVNTGLEPISDQTFEGNFHSIHDEVCA